jgi:hypothetical protein
MKPLKTRQLQILSPAHACVLQLETERELIIERDGILVNTRVE